MTDFDLTTLRLFVAVCAARSIKRVAELEQMDASAITKRIAKLEDQLQTPLIRRVRQGVEATAEGAILCAQAAKLVSDAQQIALGLSQRKVALTGSLTIASSTSHVASHMTDDLASFLLLLDHRHVQIVVHEMTSKDVVQSVRDGRASVGVIWDNIETSGLQEAEYYHDHIAVAACHGHPLCDLSETTMARALQYDMVSMKHTRHSESYLVRTGKITSPQIRSRLQVPTWEAGLRAAAHGVGLFLCSASLARMHAATWGLHVIPLTDAWAQMRNKIVYPTESFNPLVMQLIAHLSHRHRAATTTS